MKRIRPFPFDRLARLARAQVEAGRLLLAHLPLAAGPMWPEAEAALGGDVKLRLIEAYAFSARELAQRLSSGAVLRLAAAVGHGGLLWIDGALAVRLAKRALGIEDNELAAARPLSAPEQGALAFLVEALVGEELRVEGFLEGQLEPEALFTDPWVLALELRIETSAGSGWARILAPEQLRHVLAPRRQDAALWSRARRLAEAQVSLHMEVGRTRLERRQLASLGSGDVVLFDDFGPRPPFGGPMKLRLGRGSFAARLGGDGLTIVEPFQLGVPRMDETQEQAGSKTGAGSSDELLRELPVEVVCELGRVTMSGRELLELRPGAVIPVGRPLAGPVDLTVGGRVVARGELVDIEGEIGVRVVQMND